MASSKIKGIVIEIGGETTKLGKALESAEKSTKSLQSELKGVNTLLKMDPGNVELLKQKQDLLTKSVSSTEDKLSTLKSTMQQIKSGEVEVTEEQFRDLQREIVSTEQKLEKLKDQAKDFGSVFKQEMQAAGDKVKEIGGKVEDAGKKMGGISTAAAGGLGAAITAAAGLEDATNKYLGATGKAVSETEKYQDVLKSIHDNNYGEDYADIADKMRIVSNVLGDLPTDQLQNVVEKSYMLEDAYGMDFQENVRGVNSLMDQFGITADQAYELINQGAQKGLNQNQDLTDQIAEYSTYYAKLGFSAEDFFNIMIAGSKDGAYQIDFLNDAMKEFGIRTKDNSTGTTEAFKELGLNAKDITDKFAQGGDKAQEAFAQVTSKLMALEDPVKKNQLGVQLFGTKWEDLEASAVNAMTTAKDEVSMLGTTVDQTGETMYGGTANKAQTALRSIKTAFAELGNALLPIVAPIIEKVTEIAKKFAELSPTTQKIILGILAVTAALAPALIIVGKVITSVGTITSALGKLGPVFTFIKTAISGLFTLIMAHPLVAIVVGIIALIVLLWTKCEWFRNMIKGLWDGIKAGFEIAVEFIGEIFSDIGAFFAGVWEKAQEAWNNIQTGYNIVVEILNDLLSDIGAFFVGVWEKAQEIWNNITEFLNGIATWIYDNVITPIINLFTPLVTFFVELVTSISNTVRSIIEVIVGLLKGTWLLITTIFGIAAEWFNTHVITPIANFFISLWNGIKTAAQNAWNFIKGVWNAVSGWFNNTIIIPLANFFVSLWNGIKTAAQNAWNFIKGVWNAVSGWFNNTIIKPVGNFFSNMWNGLKNGASLAWNGIKSIFGKVADFFGTVFGNAWNRVKDIFSVGGEIFTGITEGISRTFKTVVNGIIGGINKVVAVPFNAINGLLNKIRNVSVAGISPFKDFIKYNALSVPQIPKLKTGTNKIESEGLYHLHKNEAVIPAKYNPAIDNSGIKNAMMDALTDFTNIKSQGITEINKLTELMNKYMPVIVSNLGQNIVLDDGTLVGKILPKVDKGLGNEAIRRKRGY